MAKKDNKRLTQARVAKKDEFYTQMCDIENELKYYKDQLRGKHIICNCDDPFESNFVKYFILNFRKLGLKKLTATCYDGSPVADTEFIPAVNLFDEEFTIGPKAIKTLASKAYKIEITEVKDFNGDGAIDLEDAQELLKQPGIVTALKGNGDFRSEECLKLLDEADICITNPPFSLLKEFITTLIEHNKQFLIIGNINTYKAKELFPLFKDNKFGIGYKFNGKAMKFKVPADYTDDGAIVEYDGEGNKYIGVGGTCWYTNLDVAIHDIPLVLYKNYTPEEYPMLDTYPAININKTAEIPCDYFGDMAVPETFVDKYCAEQFKIIGILNGGRIPGLDFAVPYLNGKKIFTRLIIKRKYKDDGSLNDE